MQDALEVLRTTPNNVMLTICRPRDEQYRKLSPPTEPPKPPQRTSLQHQQNYGQYPHLVLYQQQQQQQQLQQPLYITQINPGDLPLEPLSPIQTNFSGVSAMSSMKLTKLMGNFPLYFLLLIFYVFCFIELFCLVII